MCSAHDYSHLGTADPEPEPKDEPVAWVASLDATILAERSRLRGMAGLPTIEEALAFAQSLRWVR